MNGRLNPSQIGRTNQVTELRSFLGFVNYYLCFVKGYSSWTTPLIDHLKKDKTWRWDARCQEVFHDLKEEVTHEPVMSLPNVI